MIFLENTSLADYSTMRLGGNAKYLSSVSTVNDLKIALKFAKTNNLPFKVIGSGSNIIWEDRGFNGLVIINEIKKLKFNNNLVTAGSGENWDHVVAVSVSNGWSGIESLSLIPGTAGATPVQNVGAYGSEISDVLISIEALDSETGKLISIKNKDCGFGYRTSRFKTKDKDRYIITEILLKLSKTPPKPPFYESLDSHISSNNITNLTSQDIRNVVIKVRQSKLPDPEKIANCGSFFANPFITKPEFNQLQKKNPSIKGWSVGKNMKISAGWLIENVGFKDFHDETTGMATWKNQSLVLVNENARSTQDLLDFKYKIEQKIEKKYGILLEQEPELIMENLNVA